MSDQAIDEICNENCLTVLEVNSQNVHLKSNVMFEGSGGNGILVQQEKPQFVHLKSKIGSEIEPSTEISNDSRMCDSNMRELMKAKSQKVQLKNGFGNFDEAKNPEIISYASIHLNDSEKELLNIPPGHQISSTCTPRVCNDFEVPVFDVGTKDNPNWIKINKFGTITKAEPPRNFIPRSENKNDQIAFGKSSIFSVSKADTH